jgi:hypothetical protein
MKRVDRDAMKRAIEEVRRKGGEDLRQIEQKLRDEPWEQVGEFASYSCQCDNLNLEPWQSPPCCLRTDADLQAALAMPYDHSGWREAAEIVLRLRAHKLSYLEPNPLEALERVEAERAVRKEEANVEPAGEDPRTDVRGSRAGTA